MAEVARAVNVRYHVTLTHAELAIITRMLDEADTPPGMDSTDITIVDELKQTFENALEEFPNG